jgi:hypothetical protein
MVNNPGRWSNKTFKAFWRGEATGGNLESEYCQTHSWTQKQIDMSQLHRHKLVKLCQNISDCDAGFTQIEQCSLENCEKVKQQLGIFSDVPIEDYAKFKVVIDIDGNTHSRRFS